MFRLFVTSIMVLMPFISTAGEFKVGDKVFLKPDAEATINGTKADVKTIPNPMRIVEIDGAKIRLKETWVRLMDVMTINEAWEYYNEAILKEPSKVSFWEGRGRAWIEKEDFERAIADFTEMIKLDPNNSMAYVNRGQARGMQEDIDKALDDFNEAIRLDSNSSKAFRGRAAARISKDDLEAGGADLEEAIRLDPSDALNYAGRAHVLQSKGELDHAIQDFNKAISLDPYDSYSK